RGRRTGGWDTPRELLVRQRDVSGELGHAAQGGTVGLAHQVPVVRVEGDATAVSADFLRDSEEPSSERLAYEAQGAEVHHFRGRDPSLRQLARIEVEICAVLPGEEVLGR